MAKTAQNGSQEVSGALPSIPLPTKSITLSDGSVVLIHSLSRADALKVTNDFRDKADEAEIFILVHGVVGGVSKAEATKWRQETAPEDAGLVIDGIIFLTGLAEPPKAGKDGPKA